MIVVKDLRVDVLGEPLFEKVNIVIKPGERVGILSAQENTAEIFLRALAGTVEADAGTVTFEGERVEYISPATIQEGADSLARVFHTRPSFLLIQATGVTLTKDIENLEKIIKGFRGGILLASEDAKLMQAAKVTRMLEINPATKLVSSYTGTYDEYLIEREKNQTRLKEAYEKQQKEKRRLEEFIDQKRAAAARNRSPEIGATIRTKKKYLQREILDKVIPKPFDPEEKGRVTIPTLRPATEKDAKFLFDVKIEAMSKVHEDLHPNEPIDLEKAFAEYMQKFEPGKVSVIEYDGKDVGRLRVVRSAESIYIGGLQILPQYQKKGIGSSIFKDLMEESDRTHKPILTEIHHVNTINITWKKKLGFKEIASNDMQVTMRYN